MSNIIFYWQFIPYTSDSIYIQVTETFLFAVLSTQCLIGLVEKEKLLFSTENDASAFLGAATAAEGYLSSKGVHKKGCHLQIIQLYKCKGKIINKLLNMEITMCKPEVEWRLVLSSKDEKHFKMMGDNEETDLFFFWTRQWSFVTKGAAKIKC